MTLRAVVAVPRGEVMAMLEAIRLRYDPFAGQLPAHVTIVFPFDSDIVDDTLRSHVEALGGAGIAVHSPAGAHRPARRHHLGASITTGSDSIVGLHARQYTGPLARHRSSAHGFAPQVTVGRFDERSAMEAALRELSSIDLMIDTIVTAVTIWELTPGVARATEVPLM